MLLTVIIVSCSKNKDSNDQESTNSLELSKTEYKGCFISNPIDSIKDPLYEKGDSLFYTVENDTLLLHMIMNYNCCGLLKDSLVYDEESVNVYIHDTCMQDCICYCMCDFEFEYSFLNFSGNNIHFYIYLKGHEEDEYSLWGDLVYP